ncbi:Sugar phosphate isomerase/epimerase [Dethiosulfatibacter aminovorans DSM 17477]|uniref:Sugar phosphate isomerase/epimerase n=1 Tax=Dethiosulfatibacter aminovorans DSM 17477 TaxID=1121476 RepID=A0A1M6FVQ3_9FIRM|nr:sugar phosphate isomerase/epimerase family protein [Dethiosulfatibacter aminovorans]SHJ01742.1 Sugar phosphate isomerase/epimerase [Dethiosulfatibacter aminovorans DSM 17477]
MDRKIGIYSWFGVMLTMEDRLREIKKAGFDSTMLWWGDEVAFWDFNKEELVEKAEEIGLLIENIHLPYYDINSLWEKSGDGGRLVNDYKGWIKDCSDYGIGGAVIHLEHDGYHIDGTDLGFERLYEIIDYAEKMGVDIAVENTRNIEILRKVLNNFKSKHLKFCYDSSHDWVICENPGDLILEFGDRLKYLHLSDNDMKKDRHWIPGTGKVDWELIAENFSKIGFEGNISFEVCPFDYEGKAEAILASTYGFGVDLNNKINSKGRNI